MGTHDWDRTFQDVLEGLLLLEAARTCQRSAMVEMISLICVG